EEPQPFVLHESVNPRHVEDRYTLSDTDNERDSSVGRFHYRVGCEHWRNVNHRCVRARFLHGFNNGVEDRHPIVEFLTALAWRDTGDNLRAVLHHLARVKGAVSTGDSLNEKPRAFVDEYAHAALSPVSSATDFCTAASISVIADRTCSSRIFTAISSLVPVSRMTSGTFNGLLAIAVTIRFETSSVRVIRAKILKRIVFTLGSLVMMLSAVSTLSGLDDAPM